MQTIANPTPLDLSRWVRRTVTAHLAMSTDTVTGELVEADADSADAEAFYVKDGNGMHWLIDTRRGVTLVECAECGGSGGDDAYHDDEREPCKSCGGTGIDPRAGL